MGLQKRHWINKLNKMDKFKQLLKKEKRMEIIIKIDGDIRKATLCEGKPLPDPPKSWTKYKVVSHSIGNNYNSSIMTLYLNRQRQLKYEIYRDGCIYAYYGTIILGGIIKYKEPTWSFPN